MPEVQWLPRLWRRATSRVYPTKSFSTLHYREGDLAARDELVERFMPFARKLAVRYMHSREPMDDLVQVASIGLS